jgi:hypothetical protein
MKIRLEGTEPEIAAALQRLGPMLEIQDVRRFYANRSASTLRRGGARGPAAPAAQREGESLMFTLYDEFAGRCSRRTTIRSSWTCTA